MAKYVGISTYLGPKLMVFRGQFLADPKGTKGSLKTWIIQQLMARYFICNECSKSVYMKF